MPAKWRKLTNLQAIQKRKGLIPAGTRETLLGQTKQILKSPTRGDLSYERATRRRQKTGDTFFGRPKAAFRLEIERKQQKLLQGDKSRIEERIAELLAQRKATWNPFKIREINIDLNQAQKSLVQVRASIVANSDNIQAYQQMLKSQSRERRLKGRIERVNGHTGPNLP
jgi:hypothetical protein